MKINVPFRTKEDIWRAADELRDSKELIGHQTPPIDVIYIAEIILKLDIIPLPNLLSKQKIDAALIPDLTGFYIDEEAYLSWEKGNSWVEKRLRFTFAHELGHFILHKDEIKKNQFSTIQEFKIWAGKRSNYESAEYQADEFAGRFLVPNHLLFELYDMYSQKAQNADSDWQNIEGIREHIAKKIAPRFGVNHKVIETRFDRENIWPVE